MKKEISKEGMKIELKIATWVIGLLLALIGLMWIHFVLQVPVAGCDPGTIAPNCGF